MAKENVSILKNIYKIYIQEKILKLPCFNKTVYILGLAHCFSGTVGLS